MFPTVEAGAVWEGVPADLPARAAVRELPQAAGRLPGCQVQHTGENHQTCRVGEIVVFTIITIRNFCFTNFVQM